MWDDFGSLPKLPAATPNGKGSLIDEAARKVAGELPGSISSFSRVAVGLNTLTGAATDALQAAGRVASTIGSGLSNGLNTLFRVPGLDKGTFNPMTQSVANSVLGRLNQSVSAADVKANIPKSESDDSHKVKLLQMENSEVVAKVIFDVMPEVFESRTAEYEAVAPPQAPGAFQKYKGTASTQWTINGIFVCRTTEEATKNLAYLNQLRAWVMPYFGVRTQQNSKYRNKTGAPPPVLEFSGWRRGMVSPIPVVITSLQWTFPRDVDYIPARDLTDSGNVNIPFPTVLSVSISMVESLSAEQMNGFDLDRFERGDWQAAWSPLVRIKTASDTGELVAIADQLAAELKSQVPVDANAIRQIRKIDVNEPYSVAELKTVSNVAVSAAVDVRRVDQQLEAAANSAKAKVKAVNPIKSGGGGSNAGAGASGGWT
jgi:hypothetical protein